MSGVTYCNCDAPHVRLVETSSISIFGEGAAWLAARPGGSYLAGHGWHFATEEDAMEYAFGPSPEHELADDFRRNEHG
jgi:hypothetical protein